MHYKNILVQLDNTNSDKQRIEYAAQLCQLFTAKLTGLHTLNTQALPLAVNNDITTYPSETLLKTPEEMLTEHINIDAQQKKQQEDISNILKKNRQEYSYDVYFETAYGNECEQLARIGRYHDLIITRRYHTDKLLNHYSVLAVDVAIHSGHPVILLPQQQTLTNRHHPAQKILIIWNDSSESARAVQDALPLLKHCQQVTVLSQENVLQQPSDHHENAKRLHHYLAQHGINVSDSKELENNTGEALLSYVKQEELDLIVLGAYGHSELRELLMGSSSRYILDNIDIPVFISH